MAYGISFKKDKSRTGETTQTQFSGDSQSSSTSPQSREKSQVPGHKLDSRIIQVDRGGDPLKSLPEDERTILERQLEIQHVEVTFATVRIWQSDEFSNTDCLKVVQVRYL
jgi:hypothetical protein